MVHLAQLRLRDFRNIGRLDISFAPGLHLLVGDNAQGKTNLLESIYLLATLRSFRGCPSSLMVRHGQAGYFVGAKMIGQGTHEARIYWSSKERNVSLDAKPIRKLADYFGVFRAVVFCSEDIQLVKGPASRRRRFLDLLLAQGDAAYLPLLQRYNQVVRSRNAILKQRIMDEAVLGSFSRDLVAVGERIIALRRALLPKFAPLAEAAFQKIAAADRLTLQYSSSVKSDFALELNQSKARERVTRSTLIGPHRDELQICINQHLASDFGSEGQKRSAVIALKIAQSEYLTDRHGIPPVLLVDDIMGELDLHRRAALMPLLDRSRQGKGQAFMTCTEENWPADLGKDSVRWDVAGGKLIRAR